MVSVNSNLEVSPATATHSILNSKRPAKRSGLFNRMWQHDYQKALNFNGYFNTGLYGGVYHQADDIRAVCAEGHFFIPGSSYVSI